MIAYLVRVLPFLKFGIFFIFGFWVCYIYEQVDIKEIKISAQNKEISQYQVTIKNKDAQLNEIAIREQVKESFIKVLTRKNQVLEVNYEKTKADNIKYTKRINDSNRINIAWVRQSMGQPINGGLSNISESASRVDDQGVFTHYTSDPSGLANYNSNFRLACYKQQNQLFTLIDFINFQHK